MKVIFLDHFGVMCLANKHGIENSKEDLPRLSEFRVTDKFDDFDKEAIVILNSIIKNDVEIVVSSDWKRWCNLEDMRKFYISQGITKAPIDFTPFFNKISKVKDILTIQQQRALEISNWIDTHNDLTHWVAIDDLYLGDLKNFVWVSKTDEGIKQNGIKDKLLKFLS